ncbi:MAG: hypothetical protein LBC57_07330 [Treponema sp.]|nr:hypothetical protein [Treponema sp.]
MPFIAQWPVFHIIGETEEKFKKISPAVIDRYLKKDKDALRLKGKSLDLPPRGRQKDKRKIQQNLPFIRSRDHKKNDNCFVEQKNGAVVRQYLGYNRLEGFEEQALLAAVYTPLAPLLNFFMPSQKLKSKTRRGSRETRAYDEPRIPFQRLIECPELPQACKDALKTQCALYNPVELQQNVTKAILRLRQRLAQGNRIQTREQG